MSEDDQEYATKVAKQFSEFLVDCLSPEEMSEVITRNSDSDVIGVCHSHDFCDANELMALAIEECGFELYGEDGHMPQETMKLWSNAWKIAEENNFFFK